MCVSKNKRIKIQDDSDENVYSLFFGMNMCVYDICVRGRVGCLFLCVSALMGVKESN